MVLCHPLRIKCIFHIKSNKRVIRYIDKKNNNCNNNYKNSKSGINKSLSDIDSDGVKNCNNNSKSESKNLDIVVCDNTKRNTISMLKKIK